ncbi:MAG: sulfatase [Fibrobacteres bacterium]|nr:sulfatase [Fibrobacterota bacterium]
MRMFPMRRRTVALLPGLAAWILAVPASALDVDLSGKVVNKSGAVVAGCRVGLVHQPGISATTLANGAFQLSGATALRQGMRAASDPGLRGGGFSFRVARDAANEDGSDVDARGRVLTTPPRKPFAAGYQIPDQTLRNPTLAKAAAFASAAPVDTLIVSCSDFPDRRIAVADYAGKLGSLKVSKPNIVYIMADDLGWRELNSYGNTFTETPNLDRLASQGMRFTNAYASAPVCSPTRGSLMTGQYPARVGILDFLPARTPIHLDTAHLTLAERLRDAGYETGMIGKWHLTGYASEGQVEMGPDRHGFQEVISTEKAYIAGGDYWFPYSWNPALKQVLPDPEYLADRFNAQAVDYIARHKDGTFFLYLAHMAVHQTLAAKPALIAKYAAKPGVNGSTNNAKMAAMLESIDDGVGMILDTLKALGLDENTLVIFNSDNGGVTDVGDNGPLREGKGWLYEGGIREPLLVQWPGTIPPNTVCDVPVITADMYPTLLEAGRTARDPRQIFDGVSFFPRLKDAKAVMPARDLYWHYPVPGPGPHGAFSAGAMRRGDWKLVQNFVDGTQELFNLKDDMGEKDDLSKTNPGKALELKTEITRWRNGLHALMYPGQIQP